MAISHDGRAATRPFFLLAIATTVASLSPSSLLLLWLHQQLSSIVVVAVVVVSALQEVHTVAAVDDCNWEDERCPSRNNGRCDEPSICDPGTDCFDCDLCREYDLDCDACIANSCYWLPELAWCSRSRWSSSRRSSYQDNATTTTTTTTSPVSSTIPDGIFEPEDWLSTPPSCDNQARGNLFNDPFYSTMQWSYDLIHVEKVWQEGIFGMGVHIRFNDEGVDANHPEFAGKFDTTSYCAEGGFAPLDATLYYHGTGVASIAAANKDNGVCATGIAPDATISSCNIRNLSVVGGEFFLGASIDTIDISSNSFGRDACIGYGFLLRKLQDEEEEVEDDPCPFDEDAGLIRLTSVCETCDFSTELSPDCEYQIEKYCTYFSLSQSICLDYLDLFVDCEYNALTNAELLALTDGITNGRDGKGIIYVFAAGDEFALGEDLNFEGYLNSRFTITVGGVGKFGEFASYSSTGSALFITAPGGDTEYSKNNIVAGGGGGECHDIGYGTPFAQAVVSGVVALMLEVNPDLGWRDVQGILAATAQMTQPEDTTWTTNGAGLHHSIKFGFGIVDAYAAVTAARSWENYPSEEQHLKKHSGIIDLLLGDDPSDGNSTTQLNISDPITTGSDFVAEAVVVYLELSHSSRGDLQVVLTSPQGTRSILNPGPRPENSPSRENEAWKLMTVRAWGESPFGEWTLSISDQRPGDFESCVDLPWLLNNYSSCATLDMWGSSVCDNGTVLDLDFMVGNETLVDDNGLNPVDACCACGGGQEASNIIDVLKSWTLMVYGHSSQPLLPQETCSWENDSCPYKNDGECDDPVFCEPNTDCFDCDTCRVFRFDCDGCVSNNCYWLPELGWCSGNPFAFNVADGNFTSPDWLQTCDNLRGNLFEDPLYSTMKWSYDLINVEKVWEEGIYGNGVHIRINDNGIDPTHPEFAGKFDTSSCVGGYEVLNVGYDSHGTATASIAAGNKNDHCAVGIAPEATVSACNLWNNPSFGGEYFMDANLDLVDISSNSIGLDGCYKSGAFFRQVQTDECPFTNLAGFTIVCDTCDFSTDLTADCESKIAYYCSVVANGVDNVCLDYLDLFLDCEYNSLTDAEIDALTRGIAEGRGGKGIIYVFASGNEFAIGEDLNFEGWLNSRFTITVGAVGKFGEFASYSSTGAALFIAAPGGDSEYESNNVVAAAGTNGACTDITVGTSFACPVVSGVVALMLEVRPDLGWRDVQGILAKTAQMTEPEDESWTTNGAGLHHSIKFGFGIVDAYAAVTTARTWQNYGPEEHLLIESGLIALALGDGPSDGTAVTSLRVTAPNPSGSGGPWTSSGFAVESVVIYLELSHASRGDLEIILTSPQGTESVLHPGKHPETSQASADERWKLMTVRSWGESPFGDWTLSISDKRPGDFEECVNLPWSLNNNVTCKFFDTASTFCADGKVIDSQLVDEVGLLVDERGLNPVDSCCACGGGQKAEDVEDVLQSWKLMVYGHSVAASPTPPPVVRGTGSVPSTEDTVAVPTTPPPPVTAPVDTTRSTPPLPNTSSNGHFVSVGSAVGFVCGIMFIIFPVLDLFTFL